MENNLKVTNKEQLNLLPTEQDSSIKIEKNPKAQNGKEGKTVIPTREELILEYVPLVKFIARRMAVRLPSHIDVNDLVNAGVIGLMDALDKFDPSKETQFKTYAEFRIRGAILDELRSRDWVPRSIRRKVNLLADAYAHLEQNLGRPAEDKEVAEFLGIKLEEFQKLLHQASGMSFLSLDELSERGEKNNGDSSRALWEAIVDPKGEKFLDNIHTEEVKQILASAIDKLPEKEKKVIELYYHEELTMKEIGKVLKIKESRISQLHTKAILRLRGKLRGERGDLLKQALP